MSSTDFSFVFFIFQLLTFNLQLCLSPKSFLLNYLIIYLDKYCASAVTSYLTVRDHVRRFTSSPRSLCVLRVGVYPERSRRALDRSFSLVFFIFQLSTFN